MQHALLIHCVAFEIVVQTFKGNNKNHNSNRGTNKAFPLGIKVPLLFDHLKRLFGTTRRLQ